MDVLEGILENDPSDAESDNEEAVSCDNSDDNDHEIVSDDKRLDTNEMTDAAVNDEDDITATKAESKIVTDVDNSTNKLGVESRYFAVVVDNPEDIIDANSIAIAKDVTEKILEAMKEANVTVLIGSRKEQCFIGYALSLSGDILFDTVQKSSRHKTALNIRWGKICCLPFRDTVKIRNAFNDDKPVSQFLTGQEIDTAAAEDVLYFIDDANTDVETIEGLRILLRGSRSRSSESGIAVAVTSQIGESLSSESSTEGDARKVAEPNKESSHSSTSGSKRDNEDDNSRKAEIGAGKRPRTDSVVSSGSGAGSENQSRKSGPAKRGSVSSNLPKPPRPKNMFDITSMNYDQYVDRHYAIKYEQWFLEANGINGSAVSASASAPGMGPPGGGGGGGGGGMSMPMTMALTSNMGMGGGGGGFYRGQGPGPGPGPGPGGFGQIGGPMMMAPPMGIGMGGMGMGMGGPINPLMMHDPSMFQAVNMHVENVLQSSGGQLFNDRGRAGRGGSGGGRGRVGRY